MTNLPVEIKLIMLIFFFYLKGKGQICFPKKINNVKRKKIKN